MVKTLVTDGFEDDEFKDGPVSGDSVHNIVYGSSGYTDALDDATITLLLGNGIIVLARTVTHSVGETRVYVPASGVTV